MNFDSQEQLHLQLDAKSFVDLSKYDISWFDRGRPKWFVLLWWLVQAIAFPLSWHNLNSFRCWLLKLFGAKVGKRVVIRPSARFTYPWKITIGDDSWIGDDVNLYSIDEIIIGSQCVISQKSYLCTGSHKLNDPAFGLLTAPIKIGNGVWLAYDCFVAPGVQIGANTVIGSRSSVFTNIPNQKIAFGTPCRVQRHRVLSEN